MPAPAASPGLAAIVLAGGAGRRLGGPDKPGLVVGGRTLLDHVLLGCPAQAQLVVVGPRRPTARPVVWTREHPPGGGPVAGIAAGLEHVLAPLVLLLASDLPRVGAAVPILLDRAQAAVGRGRDGAVMVDESGRRQPLVCCVGTVALRSAIPDEPRGVPVHRVLGLLRLDEVPAPAGSVSDVDTPEALALVRQDRGRPHEHPKETS